LSFWRGKNVLVTGGAGFLGSFVVKKLAKERGVKPENIQVPRSKEVDLRKWENCVEAVEGINVVIHLAARAGVRPSIQHPRLYHKINIEGTLNLLEICSQYRIPKFILASSSSVNISFISSCGV